MRDGDAITCLGCGKSTGSSWPETPVPDHCGKCPPWVCDGCGEMTSLFAPCKCWIPLTGMALADLKALFAANDMGVTLDKGHFGDDD